MTDIFLDKYLEVPEILEKRINERITKEAPELHEIYPQGARFQITSLTPVTATLMDETGGVLWMKAGKEERLVNKITAIADEEIISTIKELYYEQNRKPIWNAPLEAEKDLLELQEEINTIIGLAKKLLQVKIEFLGWQAEHRMMIRHESRDRLLWCLGQMRRATDGL